MTSIAIDRRDGLSSATAIKGPCRVATTANILLEGLQTIDGVAVVDGDRVLVKDQGNSDENGIYVCDTGTWARAKDFSRNRDVRRGTLVNVTGGTGAGLYEVTASDDIHVGDDAVTFAFLAPPSVAENVSFTPAGNLASDNVQDALEELDAEKATAAQGALADTAVQPGAVREKLTANRTYYVRTDGSDSNDGLSNTSGGAFLTKQAAVNAAYALDWNGYTVTIQVADGTYSGGVSAIGRAVGQRTALVIRGNTSTPANAVVSTTSANCFSATLGADLLIDGFELQTATAGGCLIANKGGSITYANTRFGTCAGYHKEAGDGGRIYNSGDYSIVGGAVAHEHIPSGGYILNILCTVTLVGTPAFSAFYIGVNFGYGQYVSVTFSGPATGQRFLVHLGGQITGTGGDPNYFPGSIAGRVYGGAQMDDYSEPYYAYQEITSDRSLSDATGQQALFPSTSDVLSFALNTKFLIEAEFLVTRSAGTTAHTIQWMPGGALGTGGEADWVITTSNPDGATLGAESAITTTGTSQPVITPSNNSASENVRIRIRGIWRAGSTTSLWQPAIGYSAAPGGAPTVKRGSWVRVTRLGPVGAPAAIGPWA